MIALYVIVGLVAAVLLARLALDQLAHRHHWRIGRWSDVLPGWKLSRCLRCRTSWRYAIPHDTPFEYHGPQGDTTTRHVFAVCEPCWQELRTGIARLPYYEQLWLIWEEQAAAQGIRRDPRDLVAIRASLEVGL